MPCETITPSGSELLTHASNDPTDHQPRERGRAAAGSVPIQQPFYSTPRTIRMSFRQSSTFLKSCTCGVTTTLSNSPRSGFSKTCRTRTFIQSAAPLRTLSPTWVQSRDGGGRRSSSSGPARSIQSDRLAAPTRRTWATPVGPFQHKCRTLKSLASGRAGVMDSAADNCRLAELSTAAQPVGLQSDDGRAS
jgi:hypothetical protein